MSRVALKTRLTNYISQRDGNLKTEERLHIYILNHHLIGGDFLLVKYLQEDVIRDITSKGFEILEYVNRENIFTKDADGYLYKINYHNFIKGQTPHMLMKNPFALENLKRYLSINYPYFECLETEYHTCKTKMRFICHKHEDKGIQLKTPDKIINKEHVCRYCGYENGARTRLVDESLFIKKCDELSLEYVGRTIINNNSHILFICPKHRDKGVQHSSWTNFKRCTNGCIHCSSSSGEIKIRKELTSLGYQFDEQYQMEGCVSKRNLKFDFFIPKLNLAIEYDGQQHFEPVDFSGKGYESALEIYHNTMMRDRIKNDFCANNNIRLLRIPYTEYENIHDILVNNLVI